MFLEKLFPVPWNILPAEHQPNAPRGLIRKIKEGFLCTFIKKV